MVASYISRCAPIPFTQFGYFFFFYLRSWNFVFQQFHLGVFLECSPKSLSLLFQQSETCTSRFWRIVDVAVVVVIVDAANVATATTSIFVYILRCILKIGFRVMSRIVLNAIAHFSATYDSPEAKCH